MSQQMINEMADTARLAARTLSAATGAERSAALNAIADAVLARSAEILAANEEDMVRARAAKINDSLLDRLLLTPARIEGIAKSAREVSNLPDPLGITLRHSTLPNGIDLQQITVPFGVIGMVYEARPNVTIDAAAILLMSGNAALLRGSSSAASSNQILVTVIRDALKTTKISPEVVQLVPSGDRETVTALLNARGKVDLVIPRGSASLIRAVVDESRVPTIETGAGVCHVYVDKSADLEKALAILINSKCDRPSVCNAAETLLIHKDIADQFTPIALKSLITSGVVINCDQATMAIAKQAGLAANLASDDSWSTEYGTLEINVAQVSDVNGAIEHIAEHGTKHTEAIVATDPVVIQSFISMNDCAAVMVNTSTRFTDGEQMGFGAEIGISNQKMHARGPMGLEQMTTTTWIVTGNGQIRE